MAPFTASRRSGRTRVPNKKYTNDAFENLDVVDTELVSSDESEELGEDPEEAQDGEDYHDEDGDFRLNLVDQLLEAAGMSDEEDYEMEADEPDDEQDGQYPSSRKSRPGPKPTSAAGKFSYKKNKWERIRELVGSDETQALQVYTKNFRKWGTENLLPLRVADENGYGGLGHIFRLEGESREKDSAAGWMWYYEQEGSKTMAERQAVSYISKNEAMRYYPTRRPSHLVLIGPYGQQSEFNLSLDTPLQLSLTWPKPQLPTDESPTRRSKDGWIINLGSRVRCLAWAPNQTGNSQYLAVATNNKPPSHIPKYSPFDCSGSWDSCIEIWALSVEQGPNSTGYMHRTNPPKLVHTICANWGLVRQFRWCPFARISRDPEEDIRNEKSIGLLAGVWSDGCARVLDVRIPCDHDPSCVYAHYTGAGFASRHPTLPCTLVTWLSDSSIAATVSDGQTAVWDISKHILSPRHSSDTKDPPIPSQTITHLPMSYPLSLLALPPTTSFTLPYTLLSSSTLNGHHTLLSLDDPSRQTYIAPRTRAPTAPLAYSPHIQAILAADDETVTLRSVNLFSEWSTAVVSVGAQITSMDTATGHAGVLVAGADGAVWLAAPWPRVVTGAPGEIGVWWKGEWVPKKTRRRKTRDKDEDGMDSDMEDAESEVESEEDFTSDEEGGDPDPYILRDGITRITEGYKPIGARDLRFIVPDSIKKKLDKNRNREDNIAWTTVYEEESSISVLQWNPNPCCGGWAAAGTGGGLLRVEDLAV